MFAAGLHIKISSLLREHAAVDLTDVGNFRRQLVFIFHTIRASAPLLRAAALAAPKDLHDYYLSHEREEVDHDDWLLQDLADMGIDPYPCPMVCAQLAGSMYYHILHTNPVCLLGYMLVLEGSPLAEDAVKLLEAHHGEDACRTLRHHALHDRDHCTALLAQIDKLTPYEQQLVARIAMQTAWQIIAVAQNLQGAVNG